MVAFVDNCIEKIKKKKSPLIVGLDPHYENLPKYLTENSSTLLEISNAIFEFNKKIIDAVYDLVPMVKPQIAFYERFGVEGLKSYIKTNEYAKSKGLLVIGDVKRNDISSTAKNYSDAHIGKVTIGANTFTPFEVDAVTINPYLGSDGIMPFVEDAKKFGKGIFVLVKTSNKSSGEFQDVTFTSPERQQLKLHELVAMYVNKWGQLVIGASGYSSVGAVVGATYPNEIKVLRKLMPKNFFLVPGVGSQGGAVKDIIGCFNDDGLGALINVSRGVIFAYQSDKKYQEKEFDVAARDEVMKLNKELNSFLD